MFFLLGGYWYAAWLIMLPIFEVKLKLGHCLRDMLKIFSIDDS